jgi:RND family efflux transporter MFP subunit
MQKSRLRWVLLLIVAAMAAGWLLLKPTKVAVPVATPRAAPVAATVLEFLPREVLTTEPVELHQTLALSGSLRAVQQAIVKARLAADVREVVAREGEAVKAGQVLVRMDATEYQARVEQARGNLNAALAQRDIANKTRDNNRALLEKGFISRNAFDNAASQLAVAEANVEAARGALDQVKKLLNDTVIRAPITGLIASRSVQPGEKVSPDNRLLEIVNLDLMEMEASVPTNDIARVVVGQQVRLRIEGLPDAFSGRVTRINPATQPGSRSILVYVQIANPQHILRVGMFAEAQLSLLTKTNVLALPQSAIHKDSNGATVYVIDNGKLLKAPVTLGIEGRSGETPLVEISGGLAFGAQVVRSDMGNLLQGTAVRVVPAANANK